MAGTAIFGASDPEGVINVLKTKVNAAQSKFSAPGTSPAQQSTVPVSVVMDT